VNELLSSSIEFQHYYSIVDGDLVRSVPAPADGARLFQLPVYHVENFLLVDDVILAAMNDTLGSKCPFSSGADIEAELTDIVVSSEHIKPYAKAMLDARLAKAAKEAWDAVFLRRTGATQTVPSFQDTETDALAAMRQSVAEGSWRDRCIGRVVLRALCGRYGLNYQHFRNLLVSKLVQPPAGLASIMKQILA
jgi:hypothetical protein